MRTEMELDNSRDRKQLIDVSIIFNILGDSVFNQRYAQNGEWWRKSYNYLENIRDINERLSPILTFGKYLY